MDDAKQARPAHAPEASEPFKGQSSDEKTPLPRSRKAKSAINTARASDAQLAAKILAHERHRQTPPPTPFLPPRRNHWEDLQKAAAYAVFFCVFVLFLCGVGYAVISMYCLSGSGRCLL